MRARNIKPGFFTNELLVELHPLTRILYAGLWCMADRRGLVEDRPKRIKIEILPCDDHDIDDALDDLDAAGLISRFTGANGVNCIKIIKFLSHQRPHHSEPANPKLDDSGEFASSPGEVTSPPALNPESGILNPESGMLNAECGMPIPPTEGGGARSDRASPAPVAIPVREGDEPIQQSEIDTWQALYGNINVLDTLKHMAGHWAATDRSSRKTRNGIRKSINTWLAKDHNAARSPGSRASPAFGIDGRADRTRQARDKVLAELREGKLGKRN